MIAAVLGLWLAFAGALEEDAVQGAVRSAGLRTPVAGARVTATASDGSWVREVVTDARGAFVLRGLPGREFELKIAAGEHAVLERTTTAKFWGGRRPPVIYLQPNEAGKFRTIVASERSPRANVAQTTLSPEEVRALPGSQGDPLRALQNLPGVARVPGGLGLLVLRGAAPNQSQVFFGEHPIPRAFHTPSLASVVQGGVLADLQYVPGNFDARYGNAVGGVVTMTPRRGRRDGLHGQARFDVIGAGALVEGPLRRGSFIAAAQRGYLDLAMRALEPVIGGRFLQPRYYDYQIISDQPIGSGTVLTTRFLGAGDALRFPAKSGTGGYELGTQFHRIDLALRRRQEAWDFLIAPAIRFDRSEAISSVLGLNRRSDVVGLLRAEIGVRPAQRFHLTIGADAQVDRHDARSFTPNLVSSRPPEETSRGTATNSGLYVTPTLELGRWRVVPAVRLSGFTSAGSRVFAVDPRVLVRWTAHPRVALGVGGGLYSQPWVYYRGAATSGLINTVGSNGFVPLGGGGGLMLPGVIRFLDPRLDFRPYERIGVSRALQLSANLRVTLPRSVSVETTGFVTGQREGVVPAIDGFPITPTGGLTYGVEVMVRKELTRRLYGWVAYTWMHAERGEVDGWRLRERRPSNFDQRHNFVALVGVKLPRRWEVGSRFRVVTGLPYTPVEGAIFSDSSEFNSGVVPVFGATNSARMATFHQLDVRVDKTWVLRRSIVGAYVDVQNVYNRQNPEGLIYDRFFSAGATVVGVPILPVFGVRVEY